LITNDASDSYQLIYVIAHIICNHPLYSTQCEVIFHLLVLMFFLTTELHFHEFMPPFREYTAFINLIFTYIFPSRYQDHSVSYTAFCTDINMEASSNTAV